MKVATHDGSFHADDVFAVAALSLTVPDPIEIVRTRDRDALAVCDARVDVGLRDDPATGDYDHHQQGGAGQRPNGVPYASFGLVWRAHGLALCDGDERAAAEVDARLVQGIDAIDTGVTLTTPLIGTLRPMDLTDLVDQFNPTWDQEMSAANRLRTFRKVMNLARVVIERRIASAQARTRAHERVVAAIAAAPDPRVLVLDAPLPWHEPVVTGAPDALYVVYPKTDGWGVQAVPRELGTFVNRKPLPEAWAGLQAADLAALTGVRDAVFCHGARFLAVAESVEGALELARQAVAAPDA